MAIYRNDKGNIKKLLDDIKIDKSNFNSVLTAFNASKFNSSDIELSSISAPYFYNKHKQEFINLGNAQKDIKKYIIEVEKLYESSVSWLEDYYRDSKSLQSFLKNASGIEDAINLSIKTLCSSIPVKQLLDKKEVLTVSKDKLNYGTRGSSPPFTKVQIGDPNIPEEKAPFIDKDKKKEDNKPKEQAIVIEEKTPEVVIDTTPTIPSKEETVKQVGEDVKQTDQTSVFEPDPKKVDIKPTEDPVKDTEQTDVFEPELPKVEETHFEDPVKDTEQTDVFTTDSEDPVDENDEGLTIIENETEEIEENDNLIDINSLNDIGNVMDEIPNLKEYCLHLSYPVFDFEYIKNLDSPLYNSLCCLYNELFYQKKPTDEELIEMFNLLENKDEFYDKYLSQLTDEDLNIAKIQSGYSIDYDSLFKLYNEEKEALGSTDFNDYFAKVKEKLKELGLSDDDIFNIKNMSSEELIALEKTLELKNKYYKKLKYLGYSEEEMNTIFSSDEDSIMKAITSKYDSSYYNNDWMNVSTSLSKNGYGCYQQIFNELDESNPEYQRLLNKYENLGYSNKDLKTIMSIMNGTCTYAAMVNSVFYKFQGNPDEFKKQFGFSMYIGDNPSNGYNYAEMLLDLYLYANDTENGGNMITNGSLVNNIDSYEEALESQIYMPNNFLSYLKSKNSLLNFSSKSKTINPGDDINKCTDDLKYSLMNKSSVSFSANNDELLLHSLGDYNDATVTKHDMYLTEVTNEGYVVSSWGNKYLIRYDELSDKGFTLKTYNFEGI